MGHLQRGGGGGHEQGGSVIAVFRGDHPRVNGRMIDGSQEHRHGRLGLPRQEGRRGQRDYKGRRWRMYDEGA
ncbi:hypothetical protein DMC47_40410 [Nostoc sp. 3335mG]|nr:hypothetical protein DMC47_40410 [Nostoc sp. 3335mG]